MSIPLAAANARDIVQYIGNWKYRDWGMGFEVLFTDLGRYHTEVIFGENEFPNTFYIGTWGKIITSSYHFLLKSYLLGDLGCGWLRILFRLVEVKGVWLKQVMEVPLVSLTHLAFGGDFSLLIGSDRGWFLAKSLLHDQRMAAWVPGIALPFFPFKFMEETAGLFSASAS